MSFATDRGDGGRLEARISAMFPSTPAMRQRQQGPPRLRQKISQVEPRTFSSRQKPWRFTSPSKGSKAHTDSIPAQHGQRRKRQHSSARYDFNTFLFLWAMANLIFFKKNLQLDWRIAFPACLMFFALQLDRGNISQALSDNMLSMLALPALCKKL